MLSQRDHADQARGLLATVSEAPDARISYLAALFLGGLEDSAGNQAGAARWYARAAARMPTAQTALIAGSELQHRAGARHEAAVALASGIGTNRSDPWWGYSPASDALGWHAIDLKVKGRRVEVKGRRGYERTRQ